MKKNAPKVIFSKPQKEERRDRGRPFSKEKATTLWNNIMARHGVEVAQ
jgi:hypothetical protein